MGVKHLNKVIKKHASQVLKTKQLEQYSGKTIVIDTSLFLHKFYSMQGELFKGLFHQIELLLRYNITPLYVFDGAYDDLKKKEIIIRKDAKNKNKEIANKLKEKEKDNRSEQDKKDIFKYENRSFLITEEHINWCKSLFDTYGIPHIQATGEADILCSYLVKYGHADACLSDDTDMLAFGCPVVLRDLKSANNGTLIEYRLDTIINALKFVDYLQFATYCTLLGNDYCDNIKSMGPHTSYKLLLEHKTLDGVLNYAEKSKPIDRDLYNSVLSIYTKSNIKKQNFKFKIKPQNLEMIKAWTWNQIKADRKKNMIIRIDNIYSHLLN